MNAGLHQYRALVTGALCVDLLKDEVAYWFPLPSGAEARMGRVVEEGVAAMAGGWVGEGGKLGGDDGEDWRA